MLIPTSITSNVLLLEKLTNMFGEEFSQSVIAQSHLCQNAAMSLS